MHEKCKLNRLHSIDLRFFHTFAHVIPHISSILCWTGCVDNFPFTALLSLSYTKSLSFSTFLAILECFPLSAFFFYSDHITIFANIVYQTKLWKSITIFSFWVKSKVIVITCAFHDCALISSTEKEKRTVSRSLSLHLFHFIVEKAVAVAYATIF